MNERTRISVIVPVLNEVDNVEPLYRSVERVLDDRTTWELLFVDDGSTDGTAERVETLVKEDVRVRCLRLSRNFGQTAAMQAGFDHSVGEVVVSMDGDMQNDPRDIPKLVSRLLEGYDLVAGYRVRRQDRLLTRKIPSWLANRLIRLITGVPIRDNGCSLKAYRRDLLDRMYLYSDMHRFIPAMAAAVAGARITEMPVRHHPRVRGESKYGLTRIWKVIPDLVAIKMLSTFRDRPLQMFGAGAVMAGILALAFGLLTAVSVPGGLGSTMAYALVFPSVVLVWLSLAFFLLMVGLIAEVVVKGEQEPGFRSLPVLREW
ncbi:MAG: glycosyltransferase family 2 protein [Gemmatimonadetes bacterium]|nr:glycosyltransferase family 2 protein [Gemmatimonadota bacterium]